MPPSSPEPTWWTDYIVFSLTLISASIMVFNLGAYIGSMVMSVPIPVLRKKNVVFFVLITISSAMWQIAAFMTHNHFEGVANKVTTQDCIFWYFYAEYLVGFGLYISIIGVRIFRFYRMKLRSFLCGELCDVTLFFLMNFLPILLLAFLCSATKCCKPGKEERTCETDLGFVVSLIIYILFETIVITTIAFLYRSKTRISHYNEWPTTKKTLVLIFVIFPCVAIVKLSDIHYYAIGRAFLTLSILGMTNYYYYSTFGRGIIQLYNRITPCKYVIKHFSPNSETLNDDSPENIEKMMEGVKNAKKLHKDTWFVCEYDEGEEEEFRALSLLFDEAIRERKEMVPRFKEWTDYFQVKVTRREMVIREHDGNSGLRKVEAIKKEVTYHGPTLFEAWTECTNGLKKLEEEFSQIGLVNEKKKKEINYLSETYGVLNKIEMQWRLPIENKYVLPSGDKVLPLDPTTQKRLKFISGKLAKIKSKKGDKSSNMEIKDELNKYMSLLKTWVQDQIGEFIYPIFRERAIEQYKKDLSEIDKESNIYYLKGLEESFTPVELHSMEE